MVKKLKVTSKEKLREMGRPTKYDPKYCEEIIEYFDKKLFKEASFGKNPELNDFPTIEYYAAKIRGVTRQTLINWTKEHPDFLEAFNRAKDLQQALLLQGGISRAYDSGFSRFIMNSISDTYKEKTVVDVSDETKGLIKLAYALPIKSEE
jgi:hypothetical protein